ncbi:MAG: diguanylate cyclase [Deltaproteobacteria bacterium]|nr:diguanylate cyclase [Deltaproteobacteria bacterium]
MKTPIKSKTSNAGVLASLKKKIAGARLREEALKADIGQLEHTNAELMKRIKDARSSSGALKSLNAINRIASIACRYASVEEMLPPTLKTAVSVLQDVWTRDMPAGETALKISAGIFLLEDGGKVLNLHAAEGISKDAIACGGTALNGDCLCGIAAASKEIVFSPYCLSDIKEIHERGKPPCHIGKDLTLDHSHISVPLRAADKLEGVMFIYVLPAGFEPRLSDIAALKSIGSYLGLQIENTRLCSKGLPHATRDAVTGMYTGAEFKKLLDTEIKRAERNSKEFSVMMLDIDGFKGLKERHGRHDGVEVVKTVGSIIESGLRTFDVAGRVKDEKFAVILPDTPVKNALTPAERLRAKVEERRLKPDGSESNITLSVGISSFPNDSDSLDGLIQSADDALSKAKKAGKNNIRTAVNRET